MEDKLEILDDEVNVEEPVVTQAKQKSSKTFTEAEVQNIIRDRIGREKAATKAVQDNYDLYRTETSTELTELKSILEKGIEESMKVQPDSIKLLLEKLPLKEKLEWLSNPLNVPQDKKRVPQIPDSKNVENVSERPLAIRF